MSSRFGLFAVFIACLPAIAMAQDQPRTVTGTVVDAASQPIGGVLVFVDEGPGSATTGTVGAFRLEGVSAGTHLLNLRKTGFAPRTFNLVFAPNEDRRDVGVIILEEGPDPTATLTGMVTDGVSGQAIGGAEVQLNGDLLTLSDDNGLFRVSDVPIAWGNNELQVGRISFGDATDEFWIANPNETLDFSVTLDPLPIEVGGIAAEATPSVTPKMRPFYERREDGIGIFFTHSEILAENPRRLSDVLRGIRFRASSSFGGASCRGPLIFLDGAFIGGNNRLVSIDVLASPEQVEGIEVYNGVAAVPTEFRLLGSQCGVIVIWTR